MTRGVKGTVPSLPPVPEGAGWLKDLAPGSILRRKDVAALFGVGQSTVDGWVRQGRLPPAGKLNSTYSFGKERSGWTVESVRNMIGDMK